MELTPVEYDPFAGAALARVVPTSEAQREVWLASQLSVEASLAYNESASLTVRGQLDQHVFRQAVLALASSHEMMRATLSADGITLEIASDAALEPTVVDLSTLAETQRIEALATLRESAVTTPFDLVSGPLFRVVLVQLEDRVAEIIITAHHVACDGWSLGVLAPELIHHYGHIAGAGVGKPLPGDSFADHVVALLSPEHQALAQADCAYWMGVHVTPAPVLELPTDRPRAVSRTFTAQREDLHLDGALIEGVRRLGARHGSSLSTTLFGFFGALLARLGGSEDLVIGMPAAGQLAFDKPSLVGNCVNLLPVRIEVATSDTVPSLLARAGSTILDAYEHQTCTLGTLLKKLPLPRDPSRLPLASVLFNVDAAIPDRALSIAGLAASLRSNPRLYENFELFLNASQNDDGILLELQFNTDLFDRATVQRWLALYRAALERSVRSPSTTIAAAFEPTPEELEQLASWNGTMAMQAGLAAAEGPGALTLDAVLWSAMQVHGSQVAVVDGSQRITYAQLQRQADLLAGLLQSRGIGRGQCVGLSLQRSSLMLVGQLAILRSGAAYVPLDPSYPTERRRYMAEHCGLAALVTDAATAALADALAWPDESTIRIDDVLAQSAGQAPLPWVPALGALPQEPAYIIYTSGSTGKPKGVEVPHRAVVNFLSAMQAQPGIATGDRLLAVTTLSFDIAVLELLLPLTVGAAVILASHDQALDPHALAGLMARSEATMMQATPSTWRLLLDIGWRAPARFKALVGGEALAPDLAQRLLGAVETLWNMYGPTETTVWSTCWQVTRGHDGIRIGRPIANTTVHVLDAHRQPCPIGTPGNLWIGGYGVALGYRHQPQLTAERFIDDPFAITPGARLYDTGDRVRWRADGQLEHLGRADFQVKVRGYRIELGEIEAVLSAHPTVAQSVVVVREDKPGDQRLVAYVVLQADTQQDRPADPAEHHPALLRRHLTDQLPAYLVPQHIVILQNLPLLPNGKIDRHALPAPLVQTRPAGAQSGDVSLHSRDIPADPLIASILHCMEVVLALPGIDPQDNFFSLGGHSLLASQLAGLISRETGEPLPLRAIFDAPTAVGLAAWARKHALAKNSKPASVPSRMHLLEAPLSPMQMRLWFVEQAEPGRAIFNCPSAHRLRGAFDQDAFQRAFDEVVHRQQVLRTVIEVIDEVPMQIVMPAGTQPKIPVKDLRGIAFEQREKTLMEELVTLAALPLPLTSAQLFRCCLFRLADDEVVFYFSPHHIIWDGWSFDILYQEISVLYDACRSGAACTLPAPPVSYIDFSVWHRNWMQSPGMTAQLDFWKNQLSGETEPLALPCDYRRRQTTAGDSSAVWIELPQTAVARIDDLVRQAQTTMFVFLLSAYVLTLHRLTGQDELVIGVPVRGRPSSDLDNVMGLFVNVLPIRLCIGGRGDFMELLGAVRDAVIDAFKCPDVPFEELVRALNVPRERGRHPIYQTLFSLQDTRGRQRQWGNLAHHMIHLPQSGLAEDVSAWFLQRTDGLIGCLSYRTDLFAVHTGERMRQQFVDVISTVLTQPAHALSTLPLGCEELEQLASWNGTMAMQAGLAAAEGPGALTLDAVLWSAMQVHGSQVAVVDGSQRITYAQLQRQADLLAGLLQSRGIGRGQCVGLSLQRSSLMLVGQLAILRSGAAYVPLDPSYPTERRRYMAEHCGLAALVTDAATAALADALAWPDESTIRIDDVLAQSAGQAPLPWVPALGALPQEPAYIIYTSGSTGKPKGVEVPHRAVVNFLSAMQAQPGIATGDRLLAVTTLSFDIAVLELLLPLTVGAAVILASHDQALDPHALAGLMARSEATMMQATPSTWRLLLDIGWRAPARFKALVGGEALAPDLAQRLLGAVETLWNMYGPTETTVWSTCWQVTRGHDGIRIGRPIANTTVHVLDAHRQPCPIGTPGNLWIGGYGVALGYRHQPQLTAERFIDDPFAITPGARLYDTGDRVRWRADGQLEHLGRADFQVKVRGYRIELGEIEAVLSAHPTVAQSVVVVREDKPGDQRLVAYVVLQADTQQDRPADPAEHHPALLRRHLTDQLPAYLVPQHIVILQNLPLLPNGKIDRHALPAPLVAVRSNATPAIDQQLRSETERLVAEVWQDLLKVPQVRPHDNFFDLGGYSLLAMQAILAIERRTGKSMPPTRYIFETLRQVALAYDETAITPPKRGLLRRIFPGIGRREAE